MSANEINYNIETVKMRLLIILALIVNEITTIHLKLPLESSTDDFHIVTTKTDMTMEDGSKIDCEFGTYESNNNIPITMITLGEVELLNNIALVTPGFRRWVYSVKINNKELIIIISGSFRIKIEECYLIIDNILHSLIDLDLGMKELFGGYNSYSEKIRNLIRGILTMISTHGVLDDIFSGLYQLDMSGVPVQGRNIYVPEYQSLRPLEISESDWIAAGPSQDSEQIYENKEENEITQDQEKTFYI
ncbi:hypothetical protein MACJ_002006 [Theileria orientalis]|uniref:Uncharacterized protein n=1 Tax=Theileria orientalis TaxID=68886 RepID=A0A976M5D3_THEOR|nr:hypothetical protein MACJ_002006 [Theileria orientalis]